MYIQVFPLTNHLISWSDSWLPVAPIISPPPYRQQTQIKSKKKAFLLTTL